MDIQSFLPVVEALDVAAFRAGRTPKTLLIASSDPLHIAYAPFDHIQRGAQIAIVGLTPGRTQAANALEALQGAMKSKAPLPQALAQAKRIASFSGAMRSSLLAMLDVLEVPALFGRTRAAEFFAEDERLVHFTSALRYPVFVGEQNYSGSPDPLGHPLLRRMIDTHLAEEVVALPDALWVPLGKHAEAALVHLSNSGRLDRRRILAGMPHPSGANAERISYFLGRKDRSALSAKTNAARIDDAKRALTAQIAALRQTA